MRKLIFFSNLILFSFLLLAFDFPLPKKTVVVLDAGHGGKDPGKLRSSKNYLHEKDLNLKIALKVGQYLVEKAPNIQVVYTRTTDVFVSLEDRVKIANDAKADLFISIHADSNPNKKIYGMRAHIHSHDFKISSQLAYKFENEFAKRAGRHTRGVMDSRQRGYNLYVLQYTNMPGVLLEVGYMSNAAEEKYLNTATGQDVIASAIFRVIRDYFKANASSEDRSTIYRVQVMASKTQIRLDHPDFVKLGMKVEELYQESKNGYHYKYVVGRDYAKKDIEKKLAEVKKAGFKDAFVISVQNIEK